MKASKEEGDFRRGRFIPVLPPHHQQAEMILCSVGQPEVLCLCPSCQGELCPGEGSRPPVGGRRQRRCGGRDGFLSNLSCKGKRRGLGGAAPTASRHGGAAQARRHHEAGKLSCVCLVDPSNMSPPKNFDSLACLLSQPALSAPIIIS